MASGCITRGSARRANPLLALITAHCELPVWRQPHPSQLGNISAIERPVHLVRLIKTSLPSPSSGSANPCHHTDVLKFSDPAQDVCDLEGRSPKYTGKLLQSDLNICKAFWQDIKRVRGAKDPEDGLRSRSGDPTGHD